MRATRSRLRRGRSGRRRGGLAAGALLLAVLAAACGGSGPPAPARLDSENDPCAWCRMTVSSPRFAAQIVAPGELPLFFDDLGCLRDFLARAGALPAGSVAYVADHRTGEWVPAGRAVFTRRMELHTPMGSHLVAHADAASRDADAEVAGGEAVSPREVLRAAPEDTGP